MAEPSEIQQSERASERARENVYRATDMDDGILYARCQLNRIAERSLLSRCAKLSVDAIVGGALCCARWRTQMEM